MCKLMKEKYNVNLPVFYVLENRFVGNADDSAFIFVVPYQGARLQPFVCNLTKGLGYSYLCHTQALGYSYKVSEP